MSAAVVIVIVIAAVVVLGAVGFLTAAKRSDVPIAPVLLSPHPSVVAMREREQERLRRREEASQPATALPVD
jgi:hypothetical protein